MKELWRKISHCPDYSVSNLGRVRRDTKKRGAKAGRILKQGFHGAYHNIVLRNSKSEKVNAYVHILVGTAFLGDKPTSKHEIAHWNGNGYDNRIENLRWATRSENHADKHRHGTARVQCGEKNVNARLTWVIVKKMRESWEKGAVKTYIELGKVFGVNPSHARMICLNLRWRPLNEKIPLPPEAMV